MQFLTAGCLLDDADKAIGFASLNRLLWDVWNSQRMRRRSLFNSIGDSHEDQGGSICNGYCTGVSSPC